MSPAKPTKPSASRSDGRHAHLRGTARARLLDAAAAEFAEHGYAGTSVQAIARRAGLTRGAIYWNFNDKQELFLALLDERIDRPARELMRLTETAPAEQATAAAVRDPTMREAFTERQHDLREVLARALRARHATTGIPLTYPADRLAAAVLALAHGIAMNKLVDPHGTPDELQGEILDLLYDGLAHRAGKRTPCSTGSG